MSIVDNRRKHLLQHISLDGIGLELGPYCNPTVSKAEARIMYADYKTQAELAGECTDPSIAGNIPVIDFVVANDEYNSVITDTFDYIIANHVFEHVSNPIRWLQMVNSMLRPGGVLFLAIPDKKYNFDRYRADTEFSHVLFDYYEKVDRISQEHVLQVAMYYDMAYINLPMTVEQRLVDTKLKADHVSDPHIGIHCHVFQAETFMSKIMKPILHMGLVEFNVAGWSGAKENHGEFYVILRKEAPNVALQDNEFYMAEPANPLTDEKPGQPERIAGLESRVQELMQENTAQAARIAELNASVKRLENSSARELLGRLLRKAM